MEKKNGSLCPFKSTRFLGGEEREVVVYATLNISGGL